MLNLVAFHAELPDKPQLQPPHPKHLLERVEPEHGHMLDLLGRSALVTQQDVRLTLLANEHFKAASDCLFEISRVPVRSNSVMLDRTRAQKAFVETTSFVDPIIFADTDMLINRNLAPVFDDDFDIGLTWRASSPDPINGGIVFINNRRPEAAKTFFQQFLRVYETKAEDQAIWFGDQVALREMLGIPVGGDRLPEPQCFSGVRVAFLPCETYNFTPVNHPVALAEALIDKAVLHFKGPRKWMMYLYWDAYFAGKEGRSGAEYVEKSARRRIAELIQAENPVLGTER